ASEVATPVVLRCDHAHHRSGFTQAGSFLGGELAVAQDDALLVRKVEEDWVIPHAVASSLAASSSTRATSGRVNSGGRSAPSSSSFLTAVPLNVWCSSFGCGHVRVEAMPPHAEQKKVCSKRRISIPSSPGVYSSKMRCAAYVS